MDVGRSAAKDSAPTITLLVLGAAGDVTERWLLPGLAVLLAMGRLGEVRLIGADRVDWDDEQWRKRIADAFAMIQPPPRRRTGGGRCALPAGRRH